MNKANILRPKVKLMCVITNRPNKANPKHKLKYIALIITDRLELPMYLKLTTSNQSGLKP